MSWYCLTSGDERSAIKIEGYARNDDAREALSKLRGASLFLCAAPPLLNLLNLLNPLNLPNPFTFFAGSQWDDMPRWLTLNFSFLEKFNPHTLAFRSIIQIGNNLCV